MKKNYAILFLALVLALASMAIMPLVCFARPGTLVWDASSGEVTGYRIYYGESQGSHPTKVEVGNVTQWPLDLLNWDDYKSYYVVTRAYNDAGESGDSNEVESLAVFQNNQPPVADAGDNVVVNEGETGYLSASRSSDDYGIANFVWAHLTGPELSLSSFSSVSPSFPAPEVEGESVSVYKLTVYDTAGLSAFDTVSVTIKDLPENQPPIAVLPAIIFKPRNSAVVLDGSGSTDDQAIVSYQWQQVMGAPVSLSDSNAVQPAFTAPAAPGILRFSLTVQDAHGLTSTAYMYVRIL